MKKLPIYLLLILIVSFASCVEEINPDFEFNEQVFIFGLLTHEEDFVSIEIQKTVPVADITFNPINNAQVSLFTRDASNTVSLVSDSFIADNGVYTSSEMINPVIGNAYWIEVILQDQTLLISEEEILTPPLPILDMVKTGNIVRINIASPIEEQNYYLFDIEIIRDGEIISEDLGVGNDRINDNTEEPFIDISIVNTGDTVRASLHNINFNTFEFYNNLFSNDENPELSFLFLPVNIVGNITNRTTNTSAFGNFGVAGFSTRTADF